MQETTQGNGQLELKPSHLGKIEASLRAAAETEAQRDLLVGQLNDARIEIRALQAELGATQVAQSRLTTELENYRRERDEAVGGHAEALAILAAAATILTQQVEKSKAKEDGS